jgi:hypothetical protein
MPRGRTRSRSRDRARRKSGSRRTRSRDHSKRHRRDDDRRGDGERRTKHARSSRRGERRRTSSSRRSRSPARNHNDDRRKRNDKRSSAKATELSDSQRIAAQLAAGAGVGAAINAAPIQPIQQHLHHHHHPNAVLHAANAPSPFTVAAVARPHAIAGQPLTQGMFQPAQLLNKSAAALSALAALGGGASGATTATVATPALSPPVVPAAAAPAVVGTNGIGPQEKWQKEQLRQKEEYDRQQEYLQHERMREQEAAAREMQRQAQETATATGADVVPQGREAAKVDEEEEEEIDPLDQFMQKQENLAKEELQDALQREHIDKLTFLSGGTVEDDDEATAFTSADASKHCYICKENGHTKGDCPQKRCPYCTERGHIQIACPAWLEHNAKVQAEEKARKRKRQRELLKAKKKQQAIHQLRDSGVYGYKELYNLLGLPDDKLAPMGAIKKAFQVQSLKWHPDKWSGKSEQEQADAAAHYSKVREAYDVLNEGLERGFAGGGALVSGGTIAGSS